MTTATPTDTCTQRPVWTSGAVNKFGRFDAYTDYRWECGCGHRYGNATPTEGDVNAQHAQHTGYFMPGL